MGLSAERRRAMTSPCLVCISDRSRPFDLLDIGEYDCEQTVGGLGRFLVFSAADRYHCEYRFAAKKSG